MNRQNQFHQEFVRNRYAKHHVLRTFLKSLPDTVSAIKFRLLFENSEWQQLLDWDTDPKRFNTAWSFQDDYFFSNLLKKFKDFDLNVDRKGRAVEKWRASEQQCKETNVRFRDRCNGHLFDHSIESILSDASRIIASTLGTLPTPQYISTLGAFGPGVDLSSKGRSAPCKKLSDAGQLTLGCREFIIKSDAFSWPVFEMMKTGQRLPSFEVVMHNRVTFVPKNAKTDRAIAIEPRWNIFFQKAYGSLIRRKLKRQGIDLDSQEKNRALCRDLSYATIDLSNASDTMSYGLVLDLLPYDWFASLDALRCSHSLLDKELILLEKFSSMGNGFTFELESLIFFALAKATCRFVLGNDHFDLTVFGDDIIVPVAAYEKLTEVLNACGFSVNTDKSFSTGYFRESCGQHFFNGVNVTPIYLKGDPSNVEQIVRFANQVSAFSSTTAFSSGTRDRRFLDCHKRLVSLIPKQLRYYGPAGDSRQGITSGITLNGERVTVKLPVFHSCIFANLDEHCPPRHRYFDAWVLTVPTFVPARNANFSLPLLYEKLLAPTGPGNNFVERDRGHWTLRKLLVHRYVEPGCWS